MPLTLEPELDLARLVIRTLRDNGHEGLLVGGCVRDLLLGRTPKDYDIATNARPARILELFPGSNLVGAHFGVVLVKHNDITVEVATYRSDGAYSDGRHPDSVTFEDTAQADVQRRDFAINALLFDPFSGQVFDYVGGQDDLKAGIIRAIGNPAARFNEDYLRMLRAVRFAARFGFDIEPDTKLWIKATAGLLATVSTERIRDEFSRILIEGGAQRGLKLLRETDLLQQIVPELLGFVGCEQSPDHHPEGDVWNHVCKMLGEFDELLRLGLPGHTLPVALAVLMHDIAKPACRTVDPDGRVRFIGHAKVGAAMATTILNRLKYPTATVTLATEITMTHMDFMQAHSMRKSTLKRFIRRPDFDQHLALHKLDCGGSSGDYSDYHFVQEQLAQLPEEVIRPTRLISGKNLIELGYKPGPLFTLALDAVEEAQLSETISTVEEAIMIARSVLEPSV